MNASRIIVGADGSPAAEAAVRWAADEAVRRGAELVVMHAYDWRVVGSRAPIAGGFADGARAVAEEVVAKAVAVAVAAAPGVDVRGEAVLGAAGATLAAAGASADVVVVGNRGRGGFASLLLGSVSQQVATHAVGPVVVVRGNPDVASGPVVVGTDGSAGARAALDAAFEAAALRGTGVLAVRTYALTTAIWGPEMAAYTEGWEERRAAEQAAFDEEIAAWRERFPRVAVQTRLLDAHPAEALIDASGAAQLVVVGSRGHGGFAGVLLGSVGLHLLHHAACPVVIARAAR